MGNPKRDSDRDRDYPNTGAPGTRPRGRAGYAPDDANRSRATTIKHGRRPGREHKPGTGPPKG